MSIPAYAVVKGIEVGLQYGLLAMGLVLIYRCTRVLNFAHGQLGVTSSVLLVHLDRRRTRAVRRRAADRARGRSRDRRRE